MKLSKLLCLIALSQFVWPLWTQAQIIPFTDTETYIRDIKSKLGPTRGGFGENSSMGRQIVAAGRLAAAAHSGKVFTCALPRPAILRNSSLVSGEEFLCVYSDLHYGFESSNATIDVYIDDVLVATIKDLNPITAANRIYFKFIDTNDGQRQLFMRSDTPNHNNYELKQGLKFPKKSRYFLRYHFNEGFTRLGSREDGTYEINFADGEGAIDPNAPGSSPLQLPTTNNEQPPAAPAANDGINVAINLRAGWNLVSIPEGVASIKRLTGCSLNSPLWAYVSATNNYVESEALGANQGYWLKAAAPCTLKGQAVALTSGTQAISVGWNLVSAIRNAVALSQIQAQCPGVSAAYSYNGAGYDIVDNLKPELGYWLRASNSCILNL